MVGVSKTSRAALKASLCFRVINRWQQQPIHCRQNQLTFRVDFKNSFDNELFLEFHAL